MYRLLDFVNNEFVRKPTPLGLDMEPWDFKTPQEAHQGAEVLGYFHVFDNRFLPKHGARRGAPLWLKMIKLETKLTKELDND